MYRTANLQICILYIYSTNIGTEYFKHGLYSPFFFSSKCTLFYNSNLFGSCVIHILYTACAKIKKNNNSGAKRLIASSNSSFIVSLHSPFVFCVGPNILLNIFLSNTNNFCLMFSVKAQHSDPYTTYYRSN